MMEHTDHREIAYGLWVTNGRDEKAVVAALRDGDPDGEWPPLPNVSLRMIRAWSAGDRTHDAWPIRAFDDARQMAPDQFAQARATFHRLAPAAAQELGNIALGKYNDSKQYNPKVVTNILKASVEILNRSGHMPYNRMDSTQEVQGPQHDPSREIAGKSIDELVRISIGQIAAHHTPPTTALPTLPDEATDPDQSIIEVSVDRDSQPSRGAPGGPPRT